MLDGNRYESFLQKKQFKDVQSGFDLGPEEIESRHATLFPFQRAIVRWALKRGRAAIFADTGLGKTFMQTTWAWEVFQHTGNRVLILAPLCVAPQTVVEAAKLGIPVRYVREMPGDRETGIYITNYEMLDRFEDSIREGYFDGIVLDESSILKHQDSKTRTRIIELCRSVPYKLSCTATPSPNDHMELGNQAEFLGVMTMPEMLAMFFTHDGGETSKWRLKGHGRTKFWEWLSTWAAVIRKPSDLGFDNTGYDLPGLEIVEHKVTTSENAEVAQTLSERNAARRETVDARVARCAELVNSTSDQFIVWCNLNDESAKLKLAIPDSVEVKGSDKIEDKESRILAFTEGRARVLITKPSIAGFGMNWQHCHRMAFVGLNDSYEQLYQAIRRCYRFGQAKPVEVHLISADREGAVLDNIKRKEAQAEEMAEQMVLQMRDFSKRRIVQLQQEKSDYIRETASGNNWELHLGDCVDVLASMPDESIDFSVFSPPFASLYTYSNSDRDMGNCRSHSEFYEQFRFMVSELYRAMVPGRIVSFHCMNLPTSKTRDGYIGIQDFRGELIRIFQSAGFIYHSECVIWKDPVVAMQRTKALGLLWKQLKKDSTMSRQGIPDYLVTMRKPGENPKPVSHADDEFPVKLWQHYASPVWMDIKPNNTLNGRGARENEDERHICPLQLDLIERAIFLWSNPGDVVFSPFAGIGSEGYQALRMGRKFVGSELKGSYFRQAVENLRSVENLPPTLSIPPIQPAKYRPEEKADSIIETKPSHFHVPSCSDQLDVFDFIN